jgi:hypothetical protein
MNRKRIRRDLRVLDAVQDAFKRYSKAHYYVDKVLEPAYDMPNTVVNDAAFGAALPFIRSLAQTFSILDRLVTARVEHGGAARARRKAKAERLTGGLPAVEVVT